LPLFIWFILTAAPSQTLSGTETQRSRWWAVGVFIVMAITDKLDGYLARRFQQCTKAGALLDALADKLLVSSSLILLSFPWIAPVGFAIPVPVVWAAYGKDIAVALGTVLLMALAGKVQITSRPIGKASTVLQLLLVLATLLAADLQNLDPLLAECLIRGLWASVIVAALAATADYALQGARQYGVRTRRRLSRFI
jgi:CDP-diacylglycerol--glycerol-3-phosphate 3-phosphatidyltransferase